jgi:predicted dehydrogenase
MHVNSLSSGAISNAELAAVCSSRLPQDFPLPQGVIHYSNHQQLLDVADVDVVIVATPTNSHKTIGLDVLTAGRHLLMEKPAGMTVLETDELSAYSLAQGQLFGTVLNQRWDPAYRKIKALLEAGSLGDVKRISWTLTHWYRPEIYFAVSDWRGTWRGEGGGLLLNQCIHNLDIFHWLFGLPDEIFAKCKFGKYHNIEVEDEVHAIFNFNSGTCATFIASSGEAPGVNQLDIVGDLGTLRYDGENLILNELAQSTRAHSQTTTEMFSMPDCDSRNLEIDTGGNQHQALIQDFVNAVNSKTMLTTDIHEAAKSVELADAMLLSSWLNASVRLPVDRSLFANEFEQRLNKSSLRKKKNLDVTIDLNK